MFRLSPTSRAITLLAGVAVFALVLPSPLAIAAALVVLVAVVVDGLQSRAVADLERTVPQVMARGRPSPLVVSGLVTDPDLRLRQPAVPDLRVDPAEGDGRLEATVTPTRRGAHTLPPVVTRRTGALGMGRWDSQVGEPRTVEVYPDIIGARNLVVAVRHGRFRDPGRRARGPLGIGTEFESVRDYSPDDDVRQVNWRATARMGRPMSNQYRVEQEREIVGLLDLGRLMAAPVDATRTRLDVTLDALTAVAMVADEVGDRCGAIAFDRTIRTVVSPTRGGGAKVVNALYAVEPVADDSDYEAAFQAVGRGKRALVLVLTDLLEEGAARSLLGAVAMLAKRHAVVVASIRDDDVESLPARKPVTTRDVFASAVAVEVMGARDRVAARLRAAGAEVVIASADDLPAACVGAYLRMKQRARL